MIKLYNILKEAKVVPVSLMQKSPYLFIDADGFLEIDVDNFKKYILSNLEIIKNLWNNDGGDWDLDNITQEELNKAIKIFQLDFPNNIQDRIDLTTNNPAQDYLSSWDKKEEIEILKIFLNTLNDVINQLDEAKVVPVSMGYSNYEKWKPVLEPIENRLQDPIFYDEGVLYLKNAIKHAKDPSVRNTYNSLNNEDLKQYINALNFLYSKYNIKEAKVVPAGEMSNIPSSFYKAFDDIFYKILIDHIDSPYAKNPSLKKIIYDRGI